jgi:glucose/arabinose dehydrogenase
MDQARPPITFFETDFERQPSRPLHGIMLQTITRFALSVFLLAAWSVSANAQSPIPIGAARVRLQPIADGMNGVLTGNTANARKQYIPADMAPLGDGRQLIMTLGGHVRLLQADGTLASGAYLDTFNSNSPSPTAQDFTQIGNTSIATHPGFLNPASRGFGKFYTVTSERPENLPSDFDDGVNSIVDSVLHEWTIAPAAITSATQLTLAGPEQNVTRREVLRSQRPGIIHTLVDMAFTPDEYLILTSGDGGGNAFPNTSGEAFNQDPPTNAQDPRNIFGSILRIDPLAVPNDTRPTGGRLNQYYIHPNNFGFTDGNPDTHAETFAYGFRSPYRINVDEVTARIFIGDVGQGSREEINIVQNGGNYGWGAYEGTRLNRANLVPETGEPPAQGPLFELYHNLNGQSESVNVVGGFVYRGTAIPALQGMYVFADTGENEFTQPTNVLDMYYGDPNSSNASTRDELFQLQLELPPGVSLPDRIWSIAEDEAGELYILVGPRRDDVFNLSPGETDGAIYKLVASSVVPNGIVGDVNQDGFVDADDILSMKVGWYTAGHLTPLDQYTHGDLNFDGITDLRDMYILHEALLSAGGAGADAAGSNVPEPSALAVSLLALLNVFAELRRRRTALI